MSNVKPVRAWVVCRVEVDMNNWDGDVDWTNPLEVINDQIDCVGLREACNTQEAQVQQICCQYEDVTYRMTFNQEAKGDE